MKFKDNLKLSIRALLRQKVRTLLTSFAVFIGIFLIILMVSGTTGGAQILKDQFTSNFDLKNVIVGPKGTLQFNFASPSVEEEEVIPLTEAEIKKIENIEKVSKVQGLILLNGKVLELEGQENPIKNIFGSGFNISKDDQYVQEVVAGDVRVLLENEAILDKKIADAYKVDPGNLIGKTITVKDDPSSFFSTKINTNGESYVFTIVGVIDIGQDNNSFIISTDKAASMQAKRGGFIDKEEYLTEIGYDQAFVSAKDEEVVNQVAEEIRKLGFDATTIEQVLDIFGTVTGTIQIVFSMFGIIALIVASVGIINTMIMSVYERTKEIGVMKAIGASKASIRNLFLTEAAIIGFLGGFLALIFSLGLMAIIEFAVVKYVFPAQNLDIDNVFTTPLWLMIGPVAFSTLIGMIAGVYPAFRASNLKPVDALRYE